MLISKTDVKNNQCSQVKNDLVTIFSSYDNPAFSFRTVIGAKDVFQVFLKNAAWKATISYQWLTGVKYLKQAAPNPKT